MSVVLSAVAKIKIKDGKQAEFEATALKLVEAVNANEPGCLLYTLNRTDDPLTYVFMERYEDQAAVEAHRGTEHLKKLGGEIGPLMDGSLDVTRMQELG